MTADGGTTGLLLVNFGSPASGREARDLLFRLFADPCVAPGPAVLRLARAWLLSRLLWRRSWAKHASLGASPLAADTERLAAELRRRAGDARPVEAAYSYAGTTIPEGLGRLRAAGAARALVLPLYPHACLCTTGSVAAAVAAAGVLPARTIQGFAGNPLFDAWWADAASHALPAFPARTTVLFSAHAVPAAVGRAARDYEEEVRASAGRVAARLGVEHAVAFQSKGGPGRWSAPALEPAARGLLGAGRGALVAPFSFTGENLETLLDLDRVLLPALGKAFPGAPLGRLGVPAALPGLADLLVDEASKAGAWTP